DIRDGLGFNKRPDQFGAFPTDPYSHTPKGQGAKQPGMTGLVKEEILTRISELGLLIENGQLIFDPLLLDPEELLTNPSVFSWLDIADQTQSIEIAQGSLAFTFCQVPFILFASQDRKIEVYRSDGRIDLLGGQVLDKQNSRHIFMRDGLIHHVCIYFTTQDRKSL
ncbi:MAG TPA: hypothetical protein VLD65_10360, partial [Anaerolineales bacterium]|nr:hypothetical protein [Anaerolineales bacterium]